MATSKNHRPRNRTTIIRLLTSGFDNMTLNPSAQLRMMQTRVQRRNFYIEAWYHVGLRPPLDDISARVMDERTTQPARPSGSTRPR